MLVTDSNLNQKDKLTEQQTITSKPLYTPPEVMKDGIYTEKDMDYENVTRYIKGYEWNVTYYNLIGDVNSSNTTLSVNSTRATQSYNRILNMTIYLDSPLENGNIETLETTAIINSGIIPFASDIVVSEIFGGKTAMFVVSEITKLNYQKHNIFKVKLKFKHFKEDNEELFKNLDSKVVHKYVEDKDYIEGYGSPLIMEEEFTLRKSLRHTTDELINYYVYLFKDKERSFLNMNALPYTQSIENSNSNATFIAPVACDTILNSAILRIFGTTSNNEYDELRWIEYDTNRTIYETVWDAIFNRDPSILTSCSKDIGFVGIYGPNSFPAVQHPAYLGVRYVVDKVPSTEFNGYSYNEVFNIEKGDFEHPLNRTSMDGYYIFSEAFYNMEVGKMTNFEKLLYNVIARKNYNIKDVLPYVNSYKRWSRYEQFYIIPILILLIRMISYEKTLEK